MYKSEEQQIEEEMFHDGNPESRYTLYIYNGNEAYGIIASRDDLQILISSAHMLRSFHKKNGTEWGDWYEVVERETRKTVFSSSLALVPIN